MSIETLRRRVDRIVIQVGPPEPKPELEQVFKDLSLFSAQELAELDPLLEQIAPKLQHEGDNRRMFERLSMDELDALHEWAILYESRAGRAA